MTLGEKITHLRKNQNFTQEQLADLLGVSRQSVSKWESDIAYPETDKLVKIGQLFSCSMDYLLNDAVTEVHGKQNEPNGGSAGLLFSAAKKLCRERKSEKTVCGLPLYHIGKNAKGFIAVGVSAKGVIAVGLHATGIFSLGLLSVGILSVGLLSFGLAAFGVLSLGLLSVGAMAAGVFAVGAISIGVVTCGAISCGCFSVGALAVGRYIAVGDHAHAMLAVGKTKADGSVYAYIGRFTSADTDCIRAYLDDCVPASLIWAEKIFLLLLSGIK